MSQFQCPSKRPHQTVECAFERVSRLRISVNTRQQATTEDGLGKRFPRDYHL